MRLTREQVFNAYRYNGETGEFSLPVDGRAGFVNANGSRELTIDGVSYPEERVVWLMETGGWLVGATIRHINGNRQDNRPSNLESVIRLDGASTDMAYDALSGTVSPSLMDVCGLGHFLDSGL